MTDDTLNKESGRKGPGPRDSGIFSMAFREVGFFCEQAFEWGEQQVTQIRSDLLQQVDNFRADAKERDKTRQMEAQTRLLDAATKATQAGVDVKAVLGDNESKKPRLPS